MSLYYLILWNQGDILQNTSKRIMSICDSGRGFTLCAAIEPFWFSSLNRTSLYNDKALLALNWQLVSSGVNIHTIWTKLNNFQQYIVKKNKRYWQHTAKIIPTWLHVFPVVHIQWCNQNSLDFMQFQCSMDRSSLDNVDINVTCKCLCCFGNKKAAFKILSWC